MIKVIKEGDSIELTEVRSVFPEVSKEFGLIFYQRIHWFKKDEEEPWFTENYWGEDWGND